MRLRGSSPLWWGGAWPPRALGGSAAGRRGGAGGSSGDRRSYSTLATFAPAPTPPPVATAQVLRDQDPAAGCPPIRTPHVQRPAGAATSGIAAEQVSAKRAAAPAQAASSPPLAGRDKGLLASSHGSRSGLGIFDVLACRSTGVPELHKRLQRPSPLSRGSRGGPGCGRGGGASTSSSTRSA